MADHKVSMGLALVLVAMLWSYVASQSNDCTSVIISMSPCLNFISGNSSTPSVSCCSQLRNVVGSQPQCLCQVLNGGESNMGLNINQTQALALPKACSVQTPPVSKCNAASPSDSPSTPNSPSQKTPSDGGSKVVPSPGPGDGSSSAASPNQLALSIIFFCLFIASYVSAFNLR
ncbi:non-specific lipid transfer protein GPI-anchored 15-like [Primulina huaijiensis]|uniref:non-specific lipid transfer protein GPI-anchored 15-like n=1 Tax=Primulina huaijiensis TaxID=1492673 RepID=UPI003CC748F2